MIQLTDVLGYPILFSPNHIAMVVVNCYGERDESGIQPIAAKITLSCGKEIQVRETMNEVQRTIEGYWAQL